MNRFELTQENYEKAYPSISNEEAKRLASLPKKRFYFSLEDLEIMQCAFSTYLEIGDPDSKESKEIERIGLVFEDNKKKFPIRDN